VKQLCIDALFVQVSEQLANRVGLADVPSWSNKVVTSCCYRVMYLSGNRVSAGADGFFVRCGQRQALSVWLVLGCVRERLQCLVRCYNGLIIASLIP
jgi:hypothetical protein